MLPSQSFRENYTRYGDANHFYEGHGSTYRNPHEQIINATLKLSLTKWYRGYGNYFRWISQQPSTVLDLACGSGEVTLSLSKLCPGVQIDACDPYTFEAFHKRTGREAFQWSFRDIGTGLLMNQEKCYDAVICSFALHLMERSELVTVCQQLAMASHCLIVLTPHKNPLIDATCGWELRDEVLHDRVRARFYSSVYSFPE